MTDPPLIQPLRNVEWGQRWTLGPLSAREDWQTASTGKLLNRPETPKQAPSGGEAAEARPWRAPELRIFAPGLKWTVRDRSTLNRLRTILTKISAEHRTEETWLGDSSVTIAAAEGGATITHSGHVTHLSHRDIQSLAELEGRLSAEAAAYHRRMEPVRKISARSYDQNIIAVHGDVTLRGMIFEQFAYVHAFKYEGDRFRAQHGPHTLWLGRQPEHWAAGTRRAVWVNRGLNPEIGRRSDIERSLREQFDQLRLRGSAGRLAGKW